MPAPRTALAALLTSALLAAGCGGEEGVGQGGSVPTPIARVAEAEPGTDLVLQGRAYPYADLGYALTDGDAAVFVTALPTEVNKVQPGELLRVTGEVGEIGAGLAESLANAQPEAGFARARDQALRSLDLEVGAPLIIDPSATGEGNDNVPPEDGTFD